MKDYEKEIWKLTPEWKMELWQKYKDLNFSNKTKFRMIYYESVKHWYLSRL